MANPSDLIAHYSSQAFQTRIYALTFSGAVLAAALAWERLSTELNLIGFALIVVVGSLGELNRRYTHSYLAACRASSFEPSEAKSSEEGDRTRIRWDYFCKINERPWSVGDETLYEFRTSAIWKKFLLTWSTYVPGLLAGGLIIRRGGFEGPGKAGIMLGLVILAWWVFLSGRELNSDKLKSLEPKPKTDCEALSAVTKGQPNTQPTGGN